MFAFVWFFFLQRVFEQFGKSSSQIYFHMKRRLHYISYIKPQSEKKKETNWRSWKMCTKSFINSIY